jgi:hypothetical protein
MAGKIENAPGSASSHAMRSLAVGVRINRNTSLSIHFPNGHTGYLHGSHFMHRPPCPSSASSFLPIFSPASTLGRIMSNIVVFPYMPQAGIPRMGMAPIYATRNIAPTGFPPVIRGVLWTVRSFELGLLVVWIVRGSYSKKIYRIQPGSGLMIIVCGGRSSGSPPGLFLIGAYYVILFAL